MPRAPVIAVDVSTQQDTGSAEKSADGQGKEQRCSTKKTLPYDRAEAFYGIRLQLATDAAMRQAAQSMLAMWQAAHNTDYYITKYGTKALEQLQNLIAQFALGLRRLELEEQQERDASDTAVSGNPDEYVGCGPRGPDDGAQPIESATYRKRNL